MEKIKKRWQKMMMMWLWLLGTSFAWSFEEPLISLPDTWMAKYEGRKSLYRYGDKVGAWNVKWYPGGSPKANEQQKKTQIEGLHKVLQQENPFLMFLCEVRDLSALRGLQRKEDASYSLVCTRIPRLRDEGSHLPRQGLSFMSQIAWEECWVIDFSQLALMRDRPRRGILVLRFALKGGGNLFVYGVHLKSNLGRADLNRLKRERAMRYMEWDWRRIGIDWKRDEVIVLGDFNTSLFNPIYEGEKTARGLLERGFRDVLESVSWQEKLSIHSNRGLPSDVFDYIFVTPGLMDQANQVKVVQGLEAVSDHCPIFWDASHLLKKMEATSY